MSKPLLGVIGGAAITVNVMCDLVDQNVVEIECANGIQAVTAEFERMGAEEHALAPVDAIASERSAPRPLLLAGASKEEDRAKFDNMFRGHALESPLDFAALGGVHKIWREGWQRDNPRKRWLTR